jgi:hypothetical protein
MAKEDATKRNQRAVAYCQTLIEAALATPSAGTAKPAWEGLPRRAPEELDALAASQGAPLAVRFKDLVGDFWPEDETCDEFIATVREWRREGPRDRAMLPPCLISEASP